MAKCVICNKDVRHDGQECFLCFMERFITYDCSAEDVKKMRGLMAEIEIEVARREWESTMPRLFTVGAHHDTE
jgi:hypothetical protein